MQIYIVGKQWMWKAEHPGGQHEINALHVPIGKPVQLTMISQDVFHSYLHPGIPGKARSHSGPLHHSLGSMPPEPGVYHLFCTQYCGTMHSGMIGEITALSPDDYQKWTEIFDQWHEPGSERRAPLQFAGLQQLSQRHSGSTRAEPVRRVRRKDF